MFLKRDKPFLERIPGEPSDDFEESPNTGLEAEIAINEANLVASRLKALLEPLEITNSTLRLSPELPLPTSSIFDVRTLVETYQGNAALIATLKQSTEMDWLTGLYNKKTGTDKASIAFNQARETLNEDEAFCYIFLDIDDFKKFNKTYNSQVGDIVLRFVANCLNDILRKNRGQFAYRFGGEEFGIVLPKLILSTSYKVPERIYQDYLELFATRRSELIDEIRVANPLVMLPDDLLITLSLGAYLVDKENIQESSLDFAKGQADAAQLYVKETGKNQVAVVVNGALKI